MQGLGKERGLLSGREGAFRSLQDLRSPPVRQGSDLLLPEKAFEWIFVAHELFHLLIKGTQQLAQFV